MGNFQNTGSINVRVQGRKKRRGRWILLAAVLSVAVFCILAFWKPGFGWKWFDKEATLEKGVIELDELSFDFSASDMRDGSVSLRKDHMSDELDQEGLVSDLYEMTIDGECNDPVTVTMKVPDEYTGKDGQTLMLAIGTDNDVCIDADTDRHYYYVKAEVKGDTATVVFVPRRSLNPDYYTERIQELFRHLIIPQHPETNILRAGSLGLVKR